MTLSDSLLTVRMRHRVGMVRLNVEFALTRPWTVLFGPSGSGKTTILRAIAGFVRPEEGRIIARAFNQVELLKDATAHAEMLALTQAEEAVGDWRLTDCSLYATKEPCPMCAGAIVHTRIARVIFGASDPKGGAAGSAMNLLQFSTLNHQCQITHGVREAECRALLKNFFAGQRKKRSK